MRRSRVAGDPAPRLIEASKRLHHRLKPAWDRLSGSASRVGELRRTAERERAFRRVATLVAEGAPPSVVFATACREMGSLVKADHAGIVRYEGGHTVSVLAMWHLDVPIGGRWGFVDDEPVAIALRTGRPARRSTASLAGGIGEWARARGIGCAIDCPITVNDAPWGVVAALYRDAEPLPDVEERMVEFVQLLNCAIAQAQARAELIESQARFATASDAVRHRLQRDLHDGPQQRLITLVLQLREVEDFIRPTGRLRECLSELAQGMTEVNDEIRGISSGLRPAALARGGLPAALKSLARRCPVPVELNLHTDQALSEHFQLTIFYVVSETLTNVLKHAHAATVKIDLTTEDGRTWLTVTDDGIGGADASRGSGLSGLEERVRAVGGDFQIASPVSGGTSLTVALPNIDGHPPGEIGSDSSLTDDTS